MCDAVSATLAVISAYSAYSQSKAAQQQAEYNAIVADNNAKMAEYQAADALARGEQDAINVRRKAAAIKADQRTTMAARGLDLGAGTPLDLLDQTDYFGAQDVATARGNAGKEAYALRAQGNNFSTQAAASRAAADAQSPLLSAALGGAQGWATGKMISGGFTSPKTDTSLIGGGSSVNPKWMTDSGVSSGWSSAKGASSSIKW
jgi:hypothetical protein